MGWKMVRDRNQEHLEGVISGAWRNSPDPIGALVAKLGEEYGEFSNMFDPTELYDMLDILNELIILLDPDAAHYRGHHEKVEKFGLFSNHQEWCPMPEGKNE